MESWGVLFGGLLKYLYWGVLFGRLLKYTYKNREEENELMKDVPGWVTGTYYGQKLWNNPAGLYMPPHYYDVYMHTKRSDMIDRHYFAVFDY